MVCDAEAADAAFLCVDVDFFLVFWIVDASCLSPVGTQAALAAADECWAEEFDANVYGHDDDEPWDEATWVWVHGPVLFANFYLSPVVLRYWHIQYGAVSYYLWEQCDYYFWYSSNSVDNHLRLHTRIKQPLMIILMNFVSFVVNVSYVNVLLEDFMRYWFYDFCFV